MGYGECSILYFEQIEGTRPGIGIISDLTLLASVRFYESHRISRKDKVFWLLYAPWDRTPGSQPKH